MMSQLAIVGSLSTRIDSVLANVEGHLLADLEDRELAAATRLAKENLRAAGAVAGVVLERHLSQVVSNRDLKLAKANPTIGDFNELLKKEGVYDLPMYRKVSLLGDIRNICCHNKTREPTADEVDELIRGVVTIVKTLF